MTLVLLPMVGLLVALLVIIYLFLRGGHRSPASLPVEQASRAAPHTQLLRLGRGGGLRGVRIDSHCRATSHLVGRDYSFDTAPRLPVQGCDAAVCACGYIGLADRRLLPERRGCDDRRQSLRMDTEDRRSHLPRRQADLNSWQAYGHL